MSGNFELGKKNTCFGDFNAQIPTPPPLVYGRLHRRNYSLGFAGGLIVDDSHGYHRNRTIWQLKKKTKKYFELGAETFAC